MDIVLHGGGAGAGGGGGNALAKLSFREELERQVEDQEKRIKEARARSSVAFEALPKGRSRFGPLVR